jgi:hypothetical protein
MAHPAVRLLAVAVLALAVLLAARYPAAPLSTAEAPPLPTTTSTLRPAGYVPEPAGAPGDEPEARP